MIIGQQLVGMTCLTPYGKCEGKIIKYDGVREICFIKIPPDDFTVCHPEWLRLQDATGTYRINSDTGFDWWDQHTIEGQHKAVPPYLLYSKTYGR